MGGYTESDNKKVDIKLLRFKYRRLIRTLLLPLLRVQEAVRLSDTRSVFGASLPVACVRPEKVQPFFILGHPRSGTTMLREILNRHPDLSIPPENGAVAAMINVFGTSRNSVWNEVVASVLDQFTRGYEASHWSIDMDAVRQQIVLLPKEQRSLAAIFDCLYSHYGSNQAPGFIRWGDKSTPGSFRFLKNLQKVFPDAQFIHLVRDGRDCVASCVKAGFYHGSPIGAAYAWVDNINYCFEIGRSVRPEQYCMVRYEDLVTDSDNEIRKLCTFLQLENCQALLDESTREQKISADVESLKHHANVLKPITDRHIGKWRSEFPESTCTVVNRIVKRELGLCGYSVSRLYG